MSQLHASGYHIGGPTGVCAVTGRPLAVGEHFVALLIESPENDDLTRSDCSLEAWERGTRPHGLFGYWKGVIPEPNAKPKLLIDDEVVLDLFEQLADQTEPRRVAFRFVLALILIRKRLLACDETRRGNATEQAVLLVRHRGTPRPPEGPPLLEVIDPGLDESSIEGIMEQFESVIGGSLQSAPDATANTPAPTIDSAAEQSSASTMSVGKPRRGSDKSTGKKKSAAKNAAKQETAKGKKTRLSTTTGEGGQA